MGCHYCHYCQTTDDTRPYGPGGSDICYPCMKADPEREEAAFGNFLAQVEASIAMSPINGVVIDFGSGGGPEPLLPSDLEAPRKGEAP